MIGKKVGNPRKSASKLVRITRLTGYVIKPEDRGKREKCVYRGARNFITDDVESQRAEMVAVAQDAVRSKDPINHYVLSWPEGERPTFAQVESSMDLFLKEFKTEKHLVIYGLHADTDNYHLHIVLNRVDPETRKCVEINRGFDIEALHRAVAKIELAHGWRPERNAMFEATEGGEFERRKRDPNKPRSPSQVRVDCEVRTGEKSAERVAIEKAAVIIKGARNWDGLHAGLAKEGFRYAKFGSGAVVYVGEIAIKASAVDREASFGKLEKRLGRYQGPSPKEGMVPGEVKAEAVDPGERVVAIKKAAVIIRKASTWKVLHRDLAGIGIRYAKSGSGAVVAFGDVEIRASDVAREASLWQLQKRLGPYIGPLSNPAGRREPEPAKPNQPGWEAYVAGKMAYFAAKERERMELAKRHARESRELVDRQRSERAKIFDRDWKKRGVELNAMRSVVAAEQAAEKAALRDRHRLERVALSQKYGTYLDYKRWKLGPDYGDDSRAIVGEDENYVKPKPYGIGSFACEIKGKHVYYVRREGFWSVGLIDTGWKVNVLSLDDETVLAALQLGAQKWGRIYLISRCEDFKAKCVVLAVKHGIEIYNPELQEAIRREQERLRLLEKEREKEQTVLEPPPEPEAPRPMWNRPRM
jgi:hypothetical protein